MIRIAVQEVDRPEDFDRMPPAHFAMGRGWTMPHMTALTLVCHAISERFRVGQMFDLPRASLDEAYFCLGGKVMMAKLVHRDSMPLPGRPSAVLYIDDALRVLATSGDGEIDLHSAVHHAAENDRSGLRVPLAIHIEKDASILHLLWREGEMPTAADHDPGRWDVGCKTAQSWTVARRGPKLHLFSPWAWSDLRVRPIGSPVPRQRHTGAVTA